MKTFGELKIGEMFAATFKGNTFRLYVKDAFWSGRLLAEMPDGHLVERRGERALYSIQENCPCHPLAKEPQP
jgi:hypothetical protein